MGHVLIGSLSLQRAVTTLVITEIARYINARELRQGAVRRLVCLDRDFRGVAKLSAQWRMVHQGGRTFITRSNSPTGRRSRKDGVVRSSLHWILIPWDKNDV
jgi:hypothetical protein